MKTLKLFSLTDKKLLQTVNNHPVHILNNEGGFSPSSFIPFCTFGEHFIGAKIKEISTPVCNIFKPRNYFDQLCYETNLQLLKDSKKENIRNQLELGLILALDFNEDRQINDRKLHKNVSDETITFYQNSGNSVSIYLDTISKYFWLSQELRSSLFPSVYFVGQITNKFI